MSFLFLFVATAHAEYHEGWWGIISKESSGWTNVAQLYVHGASSGAVPNVASTETYCYAETFRWPQVVATGSPPSVSSWTVVPLKDSDPGTSITCANSIDNATKKTFSVTPCSGGSCPAVSGAGPWTAAPSATPVVSLQPGLYHVTSHREDAQGNRTTGTADVYVRPTANASEHLETWCISSTFLWPKVAQTVSGTTYERTWWDYGVDAVNSAPASVTCPGGTTKYEYKYHID